MNPYLTPPAGDLGPPPTPGACEGITQTKIAQQVDLHHKEAQRSQVKAWFIP